MPRPDRHSRLPTVGIDFGTSNSAMAFVDATGVVRPVNLEDASATLPTAVFFGDEDRSTHFGRAAVAQYLSGTEGRLMRSLKSLLGSPLMDEQTAVHGQATSFRAIVARFLHALRARSAKTLGFEPRRAVLGRPVHFVDDDEARDMRAAADLTQAAHDAGFEEVRFALEPIAAAFDYERRISGEAQVLVVDIGGGTSDFTVVRLGADRVKRAAGRGNDGDAAGARADDILATAGIHIGGTDYDRALNLARVMPLLGLGHTGLSGREVPSAVFFELATWHLIHRLAQPAALRRARHLRPDYADVQLHDRLMVTLEGRHGHRIAHAVEAAKIDASAGATATAVDLGMLEAGLAARFDLGVLATTLEPLLARVVVCAVECVRRAGLGAGGARLDAIYLTGGSSALLPFQAALRGAFPGVPLVEGDLFGGVAAGLALAGAQWH